MKKRILIAFLVTLVIGIGMFGEAYAKSYDKLPQETWSQKPNADYVPIQEDIYMVPGTNTIYLHVGEEKASQTKVWAPDTLRAVDQTTGKVKWVFSFAKPGYGWPSTEDPFVYTQDGSVYAYFSSERLLYAVNANGKEKWSKQLPIDTPFDGKLHRLSDGTLVIVAVKSSAIGKESVRLVGFDANGKSKFDKTISGSLVTVSKDRIVVKAITKSTDAVKIVGYDSSLKQVYNYSFNKGTYVNEYTSFTLTDGTLVFPTIAPESKQKQTLIGLSSSGKLVWKRTLDRNGLAFSAGNGYLFINFTTNKLSYYNHKGLVKERTLTDFNMPEGDVLPTARISSDGKILVDLISRQYILDPVTLNSVYDFGVGIKGTILDYKNKNIIVHLWKENKISSYHLT
ncbi:PQQ-binding-like beta-propeller repeat protein [Paenibacillus sp. PR3]|uniref:PQQ-binding-like beta-propeller repeat protein n=1 Tax=Paenibacillus terricola TaxID=2763503 RepID=A0ABR8MVP3_9BACL|nr:PQQ-binding-like beta-propeller repeat protein [Paenibacillus terricola]MBD3920027.1 PQQ-binding-like beta-propeller repeat protein [Paenibacillus terricola]